jgi:sugar fermentation stimulation protein A
MQSNTVRNLQSVATKDNSMNNNIIYTYSSHLHLGVLKKRYKRFLADVQVTHNASVSQSDQSFVAHCPNTGSMLNLLPSNEFFPECALFYDDKPTRKLPYTLEMVKQWNVWVGIHSQLANRMVENILKAKLLDELTDYDCYKKEVQVGESRIDFELLWLRVNEQHLNAKANIMSIISNSKSKIRTMNSISKSNGEVKPLSLIECEKMISRRVLMEVKSVTLAERIEADDSGLVSIRAVFPDTVSERAQKHISTLMRYVSNGNGEAAILFLIQRSDCTSFAASKYDPVYGALLSEAHRNGVMILCYTCHLSPEDGKVTLVRPVPFVDAYAHDSSLKNDVHSTNSIQNKREHSDDIKSSKYKRKKC